MHNRVNGAVRQLGGELVVGAVQRLERRARKSTPAAVPRRSSGSRLASDVSPVPGIGSGSAGSAGSAPTEIRPRPHHRPKRSRAVHSRTPISTTNRASPYRPRHQSCQPKTVGPAFVGVIRIRQRRCLIMAVRYSSQSGCSPEMER